MAFGDGGGAGRTPDDEHDEADGEEEDDEEGDQRESGGALHAQREQLSRKLQDIFGLDASEDVVSCHACWLFRRVLLQGHMYVTRSFVCFYAYLPSREDRVLKAGPLRKRTKRTHRFSRHWAVVRGRSLSWYESERDPYFPQDHIDLRNVTAVESAASAESERRFRVHTPYRVFLFEAASAQGKDEWVAILRKAVFRTQNEGESVRISIPLEAIVDIDGSDNSGEGDLDEAEEDQDEDFAIDEYIFLQLAEQSDFVARMRRRLIEYAAELRRGGDDDAAAAAAAAAAAGPSTDSSSTTHPHSAVETLSRPRMRVRDSTNSFSSLGGGGLGGVAVDIPAKTAATAMSRTPRSSLSRDEGPLSSSAATLRTTPLSASQHNYPPSPSSRPRPSVSNSVILAQARAEGRWTVPQWVRDASTKVLATTAGGGADACGGETDAMAQSGELSNSSYSILDNGDFVGDDDDGHQAELDNDDEAIQAQFRQCFALPAHEALVWHTSASLYRVLPVVGRLFISTNYVCFRSSRLASKTMGRTLMILPIKEIVSAARNTAYRYGHHGLVIMVRGHEELFLEFASPERRGHCLSLLDTQIEAARRTRASEVRRSHSQSRREAVMLTDLVDRLDLNPSQEYDQDQEQQQLQQQQQQHSLSPETMPSAIFKSSTSDALLDFKPAKPLHFTFLTIGSRGDVQPYIALAKGLMDEGHSVRIATHREFGSWIARHGIEFKEVGGDPAELMRICVENGTFTMSFLREGVTKFRGWLDDLLVSCWNACQGTDVIVESPSAIAGIHIAESLEVPYYRSFTMPWSRTRAYPHAFAVPGHKAGGNYNYMSYVIFDQVFWRAAAGQINSWRRKVLQLKPTNLDRMEQHKVPFLYNFSPSLVPKPLDWYDWIHVTGFWFLDNPDVATGKTWTPPADLVAFIESARGKGKKLVYIGWGSIVVSDAEAMTRCVVEAVHRSGVCAILSKGWSDRLSHRSSSATAATATATSVLSPPIIEEDIFQVNSVPHDWLFPRIDAACHHGGAGTLGASLRAGIPTIVKPYFGDQFFWGQQVEALGVGSFVRELTADSLAKALYKATHDAKTIERARQLGSEIGREDGVANAIKAIYRDMDYARSRIRTDGRLDGAAVQQQQEQQERVAKGRLAGLQLPALPALPFLGAGEKTATSSSAGIATATSAPLTQESLRTIQQQQQSSLASGQSLPPDTIVTTTTTTGDAHAGPSSMPAQHLLSPSLTDAETRSEDDWSVVSGSEPSEDHPRH
ncbi:UDP-Glycosyltransferase/glycogen phosphorylase [Acaromyces ingoldii]|uniref:Sterol 3-beta-glucosyltransferase n=1 Tax=Acaromyces ingoldii TaxID=215250 RepID=A0A316YN81_9BASI|nr:UDP-Glycosyltransferase/glycogen phosphorylase [Acaromyces ingoldii]PWN91000.1 UDP-Glycosyltransferase/glycogen phosphorylase [Acaromyces ingoldii]